MEEAVNKKADESKKKKRTSLKSIFSVARRSCWY